MDRPLVLCSYPNKLAVQTKLLSSPLCRAKLGLLNERHSQGTQSIFRRKKRAGECAESAGH